ncbi:amino acid deaminase [Saccharopolyspora subtropica]|uniref:Amino acid deaminase n=1 Tax=Saccharopolyspora thermophila TaxID=89367 RepID=A0A917K5F1_9PSEU|nr:amino acid deaminase [Saccharopolyspora subtropica]GGI98605.1 amino acid deaminase [Saccharopolyspora subtropica]
MSVRGIDTAAVRALHDERIDWRFKGMPTASFGSTVGEFLAQRPKLFEAGFVGPVLTLDRAAMEHNLRTMAQWCARHGLQLAPHGKTTMAPQLFQWQLDHGAWGITAANASQLRVYRAFGVERILLANQLVDPAALRWLAAELAAHPEFSVSCFVDSLRGVELMTDALGSPSRPVDVLVEVGAEGARTGARTLAEAREIADAVAKSPALRLVGVAGYEGAVSHDVDTASLSVVDSYLQQVRNLVVELADAGYFAGLDEVIVTSGGSAYFDQVAEALTAGWPEGLPVVPVLRSGGYLLHDDGFYRVRSPFSREHRLAGEEAPFRPAMRIWAQVTSRPEPGLALLTMGRRDVSFDLGLPEPQVIRGADGRTRELATGSCHVRALADQHAFLALDGADPQVGDWMGFGLSHPCTVFDKWTLIPVVDGDVVVDLVRTYF